MASFFRSLFSPNTDYDTLPQEVEVPLLENGHAQTQETELERRIPPTRRPIYLWSVAVLCASVLGFAVATFIFYQPSQAIHEPGSPTTSPPPPAQTSPHRPVTDDAAEWARRMVDELFERQSKTLEQATTRYVLKNNRPPPPGFEKFFAYAKERNCLIDEYDRVHKDFEPFYQIAETNPRFFKEMVEKTMQIGKDVESTRLTTYHLKSSGPERTHNYYSAFSGDWETAMRMVANVVPPMDVVWNYQDEPRILYNTRLPDSKEHATEVHDDNPFNQRPKPTKDYFFEDGHHQCIVPNSPWGFGNSTNDVNGFMLYSSSTRFTTDLYPMLSQTKITPCFSDILIPSSYYYHRSGWSVKYRHPDNIPWSQKKAVLYWRGSTTGGTYMGDNWKSFPRFRFIEMAKKHPDIMDGGFTAMKNCDAECPEEEVRKTYGIGGALPKENEFNHKYLLDIDGNTFSGRYLGMLRGNSLVFKSTIFTEFFEDWLRPFEHYVPVLPDLSDLEAKLRWAMENEKEAYRIQRMGSETAKRVMTDEQNDCYTYAVLLEYARLQSMS